MNKHIPLETKVEAMEKTLTLTNVATVAKEMGISPDSIYTWFNERIVKKLSELLQNDKPGPKPKLRPNTSRTSEQPLPFTNIDYVDRPSHCPECGSPTVWKNGFYWVKNWSRFLLTRFMPRDSKVAIRRYLCGECRKPIHSEEKIRQAKAREEAMLHINRFIAFAKLRAYLSHRTTAEFCQFVYGVEISIAHIFALTQEIGKRARRILESFPNLPQKISKVLMGDETFPKVVPKKANNTLSLGLTACEHGVIRSVKVIRNKLTDIQKLFEAPIGEHFNPLFLLTDYHKVYPKSFGLSDILKNIRHLKDTVHTIRLINRLFREAIRDTHIHVPKGTPRKMRKKQQELKKKLLKKRLQPIRKIFNDAFAKGHEGPAHIYIEAALDMLAHFPRDIESVAELYKKLDKFFRKYLEDIILLLSMRGEIPDTTNDIESKNARFAPFSKIAKAFRKPNALENFACGIALFENFDVKKRGKHKGTSAIQRAGLKLSARDFFEAVGLTLTHKESSSKESALLHKVA